MDDIFRYESKLKEIGDRIRRERKAAHMTQGQLAANVSRIIYNSNDGEEAITQSTVSNWEHGLTMPPMNKLICMSTIFDCDIGYLMGDYSQRKHDTADICVMTGLSAEASEQLVRIKESGGAASLDIVSKLLTDDSFWRSVAYINCAKSVAQLEKNPMSDTIKALSMNPMEDKDQMLNMNVYSATKKFSDCISHILEYGSV